MTDYGEAGAELVSKIASELGPDWLRLPGIEGTKKKVVVSGERVSLVVGGYLFYLLDGTGRLAVTFQATGGRLETGHFDQGRFVLDRVDCAGDPVLN